MNRRDVLKLGVVALTLPAGWTLVACNNGSYTATPSGGTTPDAGGTSALTFTSTVVLSHSHDVSLETSLIEAPPSAGASRETTLAQGHTHEVSLTQAELQSLQSGASVTKETSVNSSHTHQFTFAKA